MQQIEVDPIGWTGTGVIPAASPVPLAARHRAPRIKQGNGLWLQTRSAFARRFGGPAEGGAKSSC